MEALYVKTSVSFSCCRRHKFAPKKHCYATFNILILLTVTCNSSLHTERIVVFLLEQQLCEGATMLRHSK